jgi:hypothetical protein
MSGPYTRKGYFLMARTHLRPHTYVGEIDTRAVEGFSGFRLNQRYDLRYTRNDKGAVVIELDHLPYGRQLIVTAAEFEKWFKKS